MKFWSVSLRSSISSSSSEQSEGHVHSIHVPPQLPAKQKNNAMGSSPSVLLRDKTSTSNTSSEFEIRTSVEPSPELPPKKCTQNGRDAGSGHSSGYFSSDSSVTNSLISSERVNGRFPCIEEASYSMEFRRHTTTTYVGQDDRPPELPPKTRSNKQIFDYMTCINDDEKLRNSLQSFAVGFPPVPEDDGFFSTGVNCVEHNQHHSTISDFINPLPPALPPKQRSPAAPQLPEINSSQNSSLSSEEVVVAIGEEDRGILELIDASEYLQRKKVSREPVCSR